MSRTIAWNADSVLSIACLFTAHFFIFSVTPNINKVITTQFVLHNQSSFLWCPAEGAPAPNIVWRKNEFVVQNSTNVRYKLTVEGNKDSFSCEVNRQGNLTKKELAVSIESEYIIHHYFIRLYVSAWLCIQMSIPVTGIFYRKINFHWGVPKERNNLPANWSDWSNGWQFQQLNTVVIFWSPLVQCK